MQSVQRLHSTNSDPRRDNLCYLQSESDSSLSLFCFLFTFRQNENKNVLINKIQTHRNKEKTF